MWPKLCSMFTYQPVSLFFYIKFYCVHFSEFLILNTVFLCKNVSKYFCTQVCPWRLSLGRWCLLPVSPCRWHPLLHSTLCSWCPTWTQRSEATCSQQLSSIRVSHLQLTVLTLFPQSVSPHCLFILFGEKHSCIFHQYSYRSEFFHVHQTSLGAPHGSMFGPLLFSFTVHLTLIFFRKHWSVQMTTNNKVFILKVRRHQCVTKLPEWT